MDEQTVRRLRAKVAADIADVGVHILGVLPTQEQPRRFYYTVGNTQHGLPELLLFGLGPRDAMHVLNRLVVIQRDELRRPFAHGERVLLGEGVRFPVTVLAADAPVVKREYVLWPGSFYGTDDYSVVQVVVPDLRGRLPWDEGCDRDYARSQPLLTRQPVPRAN